MIFVIFRNLQNDEDPNNSADEYDDLSSKQFNETEWNEVTHFIFNIVKYFTFK